MHYSKVRSFMDEIDESRNVFQQRLRRAKSALADLPIDPEPEPAPQELARRDAWPVLDSRALRGVLGDLVRAIELHSEADRVALLVHGLIAFGSTLNRSAYFQAEADRHYMNEFAVM